jgi:hypothetical protein
VEAKDEVGVEDVEAFGVDLVVYVEEARHLFSVPVDEACVGGGVPLVSVGWGQDFDDGAGDPGRIEVAVRMLECKVVDPETELDGESEEGRIGEGARLVLGRCKP